MGLDDGWVEISLEVTVERRLEVLLLLSAAVGYFLEVCCLLAVLPVEGVVLLLNHWTLLLLLLKMDCHFDLVGHWLLDHCCRLDHSVDHWADRLLLLPLT